MGFLLAGTMMEIVYAYSKNIPVFLIISPDKDFENDIWLKYHSNKMFFDVNECYDYILNQFLN